MSAPNAFDTDTELLALCAILREPECIEKVAEVVGPEDWSQPNAIIYATALGLFQAGQAVDQGTVITTLKEAGKLDQVGGPVYVCSLTNLGGMGKHARAYGDKIRKKADARSARNAIKTALKEVADNGNNSDESIQNLICKLQKIQISSEPAAHKFECLSEDRYALNLPQFGIVLEADRLRREHAELIGELCVRCKLPGARTYDGTLSIADFNLSSARARSERARLLADRAQAKELDWVGYLEELCQRVLAAERTGQPAVDLRTLDRPGPDDAVNIEGLVLPRRHPATLFGDGGAAKSYLALYLAGRLVEQGYSVALFDWELCGEDHRDRLERIFGKAMPKISYVSCDRPLVYEVDRLRRIVRDEAIGYAIFDSVAFACDGPPEAAEVASRYFRAVRQIGVGSLNIAHVSKADDSDAKPFGSAFWHNGSRSTWYAKLADVSVDGRTLSLGLFNKKANLGQLLQPTGFRIEFTADRTYFTKSDPADSPPLAEKMTVRQRMIHLLRGGSLPIERIAEELEADLETVQRTLRRHRTTFRLLKGGQIGLLQRDTESGQCVRRTLYDRVSADGGSKE